MNNPRRYLRLTVCEVVDGQPVVAPDEEIGVVVMLYPGADPSKALATAARKLGELRPEFRSGESA